MAKEKIGLTLAGGGTKGTYQIGVYRALLDSNIKISGITGTSIGAFNAAMIVSLGIDTLEKFWLEEDFAKHLGLEEQKEANNFKLFHELATPLKAIVKNKGISVDTLRRRLNDILDEDKIRKSKMDFGLVTLRINDKKPLYLFKEDIPKGKIADYIVASCYLPIFKYESLDDGNYFLDGGFYDNEPSNMLSNIGYDTIYVVELGMIGRTTKNEGNAKIIRIKPTRYLGTMLDTKKSRAIENIRLGYYDSIKIFQNLDGYKYIFEVKSDKFYKRISRKITDRTLVRAHMYFTTANNKELVLKALEYILVKEKCTYTKIYDPIKLVKKYKNNDKESIAYKLISELKI